MQQKTFTSRQLSETLDLGVCIGSKCVGGEVFQLVSDLGGGKTAFVRGLSRGIGSDDEVSSPSFTINNTYQGESLTLEHFDFYRLDDPGQVGMLLSEDIFDARNVVVIEWADIVENILPSSTIYVDIRIDEQENRIFTFRYDTKFHYLFEEA